MQSFTFDCDQVEKLLMCIKVLLVSGTNAVEKEKKKNTPLT